MLNVVPEKKSIAIQTIRFDTDLLLEENAKLKKEVKIQQDSSNWWQKQYYDLLEKEQDRVMKDLIKLHIKAAKGLQDFYYSNWSNAEEELVEKENELILAREEIRRMREELERKNSHFSYLESVRNSNQDTTQKIELEQKEEKKEESEGDLFSSKSQEVIIEEKIEDRIEEEPILGLKV